MVQVARTDGSSTLWYLLHRGWCSGAAADARLSAVFSQEVRQIQHRALAAQAGDHCRDLAPVVGGMIEGMGELQGQRELAALTLGVEVSVGHADARFIQAC